MLFSPDGKLLVTGLRDGSVLSWRIKAYLENFEAKGK